MANLLNVAKAQSVLTLHQQGHSFRQIARLLGVHRETVARHVRLAEGPTAKPANGRPGSAAPAGVLPPDDAVGTGGCGDDAPACLPDQKIASGAGGASPGRAGPGELPAEGSVSVAATFSDCEAFRQPILQGLQRGLSAVRISQDLAAEHGQAAPSYYSIRRFVRHLRGDSTLPYRRMEAAPGSEAQVDFGTGAPVVGSDKRRRRTHVLRVVLSCSRKAYSEAVYRQSTDDFIRCLEQAFRHFGGVPRTLVLDNLRAAVKRADWFDPELNPKVQMFCDHYGIVALPTKPRMPRHKGKVERGIAYVQANALKGRVFADLQQQNEHLRYWEATVADTRIHGTTKRQVQQMFEQVERAALGPLPSTPFPYFHEAPRKVHRDGHVEVDRAFYSVPPEHVGRQVWVRWDAHLVRIFDMKMQPITSHARREHGKFSTRPEHLHTRKINSIERGATWLLARVSRIGTATSRWAQAMLQERGVQGVRVLQGIIFLAGRYPTAEIDRACEIALSRREFRLRIVRELICRNVDRSARQEYLEGFEYLQEHSIIRSLDDYSQFVQQAVREQPHPPKP